MFSSNEPIIWYDQNARVKGTRVDPSTPCYPDAQVPASAALLCCHMELKHMFCPFAESRSPKNTLALCALRIRDAPTQPVLICNTLEGQFHLLAQCKDLRLPVRAARL